MAFRRSSAFTLIELLASIAIIAVLIALVFAGLKSARMSADRSTCLSNLRQIGVVHLTYAANNRGVLPMAYKANRNPSPWWYWIYYQEGYFNEAPSTEARPDSLKLLKSPALMRTSNTWVANTYMRMKQDDAPNANDSDLVLNTLARPASYILQITGSLGPGEHQVAATTRYTVIQRADETADNAYFVYGGRANVLFADGHVASLTKSEITLEMCLRQ